jgi:hypothetical protein
MTIGAPQNKKSFLREDMKLYIENVNKKSFFLNFDVFSTLSSTLS